MPVSARRGLSWAWQIMSSAAEQYVIEHIQAGSMETAPYPYMYLENIFPEAYYQQIRSHWPDDSSFVSLTDTGRVIPTAAEINEYRARFVIPFDNNGISKLPHEKLLFWSEMQKWFLGKHLLSTVLGKFSPYMELRFAGLKGKLHIISQGLIVSDRTNYSIGPHTDVPNRVMSLLFYCPADNSLEKYGTSIYVPNDPEFRCSGGPHYKREAFRLVRTLPFRPNSLFVFQRTDTSFHGVEPILEENIRRDLILINVRTLAAKPG
jgi:hypothetical protein